MKPSRNERVLSHEQAKTFYDRFGSKQDLQRLYEDPAIRVLVAHADFEHARSVVELGCGTGRFAEMLLRDRLSSSATYLGVDVSSTMVHLAASRLEPFGQRARALQTSGTIAIPAADRSCDRFVSAYVLDLLGEADIHTALHEAERLLDSGGRLCLVSLTYGQTLPSRLLCTAWTALHALRPQLVGGCRPLRLMDHLTNAWSVIHHEVVCTLGVCSEVLVARPAR
jgi:ubiquinone/menaquinone biosynthesis C-methylase UbiE